MKLLFKTFSKDLKNILHVIFPAHTALTAVGVPSGYKEALIGKPGQPVLIRQNCITQKKSESIELFYMERVRRNDWHGLPVSKVRINTDVFAVFIC